MFGYIYNALIIMPGTKDKLRTPLLPDAPATSGFIPHFRISIEFKKSVRRRYFGNLSVNIRITGVPSFIINIVKSCGFRIDNIVSRAVSGYSFVIDERIYYRKLISRPSLGLSPPVI